MISEQQDVTLYVERARKALEQSHQQAALLLCESVLAKNPLSVEALDIIRACWRAHGISLFRRWRAKLSLRVLSRFSPERRIRFVEQYLLAGIQEPFVYQELASVSAQLKAWPVVCFSYETLADLEPQCIDHAFQLARACLRLADVDAALYWAEEVLKQVPSHLDAQDLAREAAAFKAMREPMSIPRGGRSHLASCP